MKGKIYVIGLGPGGKQDMTYRAVDALHECDVIAGYTTYIDLIKADFADKEFIVTGMRKETERCKAAVETARQGKTVAMVSSGDAGIYGMAGIMYEVAEAYEDVDIEVVPGITAAGSGGALLGAPLVADSCLISLSDLLTPLEKIMKRVEAAAETDFVICLYNPASKGRPDYLKQACQIIRNYREDKTPVGIVRNIGRSEESVRITTLVEATDAQVDMFTTVIIGNSRTRIIKDKMVTPRGYHL